MQEEYYAFTGPVYRIQSFSRQKEKKMSNFVPLVSRETNEGENQVDCEFYGTSVRFYGEGKGAGSNIRDDR